jgi:hypothetical protein
MNLENYYQDNTSQDTLQDTSRTFFRADSVDTPSLFAKELDSLNKNNHYVTEDELRYEVHNIQQSQYLDELLVYKDNISIFNHLLSSDEVNNMEDSKTDSFNVLDNILKEFLVSGIFKKHTYVKEKEIYYDVSHLIYFTTLDQVDTEITRLRTEGIVEKYSKEKFGTMILRIVHRLSKKANFAGYTEGWKMDFYSNALEKILSYAINNINLDMISKRSGETVKVFAYITQIAHNAFVEIINKRKQEQNDMMEYIIPFEDFYDHVKKYYNPVYDKKVEEKERPEVIFSCVPGEVLDENLVFETEAGPVSYIVVNQNGAYIGDFDTHYGILKVLKEYREDYSRVQFQFPMEYIMSFDEYTEITLLNFSFLNVTKKEKDKYIPSFPKRQKAIKEDTFQEWE